jgi:hypothetical protein
LTTTLTGAAVDEVVPLNIAYMTAPARSDESHWDHMPLLAISVDVTCSPPVLTG